ncbi:MAG: hypothetical protein KatS3mg103_0504 [Phycisphaerales bacterium]|nr:MAG: hypothetical protein KatS3mg103_0504 [Phycisphaerales bacterium]
MRDGEIVTLAVPLTNIDASQAAEQLKGMVASYGWLVPVPSQNLLIVTETGEQLRRIQEVLRLVGQPASERFGLSRVFAASREGVSEVIGPLRQLVPEYEKKIVTQGNRIEILDDVDKPPVRFQPNELANTIIAIGPTRRLETAREIIEMLDQGEGDGQDRRMVSYALETVRPEDAARQLERLFAALPGERRPTILTMPELGKITIVGQPLAGGAGRGVARGAGPAAGPGCRPVASRGGAAFRARRCGVGGGGRSAGCCRPGSSRRCGSRRWTTGVA